MSSKTTNNLDSKTTARELNNLSDSLRSRKLKKPYLMVLHLDKRTLSKQERENHATCRLKAHYTNDINSIFLKPNVSKFTLLYHTRSKHGTYFAEGKRSNLSAIFTVDTKDKDSKYHLSTYRVEFKDKESLLVGLQVYTALAIQHDDKILRSKLKAYFTFLELL